MTGPSSPCHPRSFPCHPVLPSPLRALRHTASLVTLSSPLHSRLGDVPLPSSPSPPLSPQGSETYSFPCGRWLASGEDDGAIVRELVADTVLDETMKSDGSLKRKQKTRKDTLVGTDGGISYRSVIILKMY